MTTITTLPIDEHAEQAVIGSILLERDAIIVVKDILTPIHFGIERHRVIYDAMLACVNRREPPDIVTLEAELRRRDQLDAVGGMDYLLSLYDAVPTPFHAEYYATIVRNCAVMRDLITVGAKITALGTKTPKTAHDAVNDAMAMVRDVYQRLLLKQEPRTIGDMAYETLDCVLNRRERSGRLTGLKEYDELTGGYVNGELIICAARPGMGKTAWMMEHAIRLAKQQYRVLIFSLEMSHHQLMRRALARLSQIPLTMIARTDWIDTEQERIMSQKLLAAVEEFERYPIWIYEPHRATIDHIRSVIFNFITKHDQPLDLIAIDYLGLIKGTNPRMERHEEIAEIARECKMIAREFDCPVLLLAQLNREVEHRANKRPLLSDLRDSGEIEQAADIVTFLYRESYYETIAKKKATKKGRMSLTHGVIDDASANPDLACEIVVAKNRNGPTGTAMVTFDRLRQTFDNANTVDSYLADVELFDRRNGHDEAKANEQSSLMDDEELF